jgi:hypothetical protein
LTRPPQLHLDALFQSAAQRLEPLLSQNMLSYRHLFHAGNFADVFKHALLARLLASVSAKEKPYLYLDTHAGVGMYDLKHYF